MERIAKRKVHVAPWARQEREIRRLLREGRHRNETELVRRAIDCYLEHLGRPTLTEQARAMAREFRATRPKTDLVDGQDASRWSDEVW